MTFASDIMQTQAAPEAAIEETVDFADSFLNAFSGAATEEMPETEILIDYACA